MYLIGLDGIAAQSLSLPPALVSTDGSLLKKNC